MVGRLPPELTFEVLEVLSLCYLVPLSHHVEYVSTSMGFSWSLSLFPPEQSERESSDHSVLDGNVFSYNTYGLQVLNIQLCPSVLLVQKVKRF